MKKFSFILLVCLASSTFAATLNITGSGNWTDPAIWSAMPTAAGADEAKETIDNANIVVNSNVGTYTNLKVDLARGAVLRIEDGAIIGLPKELRPGDAGMSSSGTDIGSVIQTGGQLQIPNPGKFMIGYKAGGDGLYKISGGSLTGNGGRVYVGCASADGAIGKFQVDGSASTISLDGASILYVANDSESASGNTGTGTIQFDLSAAGAVSAIHVGKTVIDSQNEAAAIANLVVNLTGAAPATTLLLIENTGTSQVAGLFDTLNGGSAAEGASVVLGGNTYTLTYKYIAGVDGIDNDIALVIPEPATIALLSLGLIAIRRKK